MAILVCGFCEKPFQPGQEVMTELINVDGEDFGREYHIHKRSCYEFWEALILQIHFSPSESLSPQERGTRCIKQYIYTTDPPDEV